MKQSDLNLLQNFANKYVWWKSPGEAMEYPERIIAQVMNIGDYDDVQLMVRFINEERLKNVLKTAEIGQFNEKSWHYWHYRLHLAKPGHVPHMPHNRFNES